MAEESMTVTFDDYAPPAPAAEPPKVEPAQESRPVTKTITDPPPGDPVVFTEEPEETAEPTADHAPFGYVDPVEGKTDAEIERMARSMGWKPLDKFRLNPRAWVPAKAWVQNKPLVDQIKELKREHAKDLQVANEHYTRVHDTAYRKAFEDLNAQKRQAVIDQDVEKVEAIDRQIAQTQVEQLKTAPRPVNTIDPAYNDFIAANPTIYNSPDLWSFAVAYEAQLMNSHPDIDARLEAVASATRKAFPEKFGNPRKQAPQLFEGATASAPMGAGSGKKAFTVNDLTAEEKEVMGRLVRTKTLKPEEYLRDIAELRGGKQAFEIEDRR